MNNFKLALSRTLFVAFMALGVPVLSPLLVRGVIAMMQWWP